jgi:hypothetical protein
VIRISFMIEFPPAALAVFAVIVKALVALTR